MPKNLRKAFLFIAMILAVIACNVRRESSADALLFSAERLHAASPDSVKAYEDLLRKALRQAETTGDRQTFVKAALKLSAQLQWTNEAEAMFLAEHALEAASESSDVDEALKPQIYLAIGALNEQKGDTSKARKIYQQCMKQPAYRNTALCRLANLSLNAGDGASALRLAHQMTLEAADSTDIEPLFVLANCYLQCDSLEQARRIYERLVLHANSKTRYAAARHLAEIAIQQRRMDDLSVCLDSAFGCAETVFFEALQQKDTYFRATLEQERRNERSAYRQRLAVWVLAGVVLVVLLAVALLVVVARHRRIISQQRLATAESMRLMAEERLRHEAAEREREAREAEERITQQQQKVNLLQRFILDKNEVLQRLREGGDHKKQLSAREWHEVEQMLDSITDGFVARLRKLHPEFREEDVQLCMLTRMNLSNQVIASIYIITVSAVKHRKLKLKKDGFGVLDPERPLDDVVAKI